jgi:hypothetical protein
MSDLSDVKGRAQEARAKLIEDSKTAIGMGNARQKLRTAQEIALTMLDNQIELVDHLSELAAEIEKGDK